ncbi:cytochrome P450 [Streptomyces acidiscabies]|uniref:Cytochrome P450 n=1 Tax=Streptomyces acidiscabies TaxID=42234 RepID=A0A0L0JLK9_9ACTN|nr:cytochrome P450 [Streptomyces acidiscabies]KND26280.1 hypothetical protein IQ63_37605 [Streptomyces acidiscabies]
MANFHHFPEAEVLEFPTGRPAGCPFDPDEVYARLRAKETLSRVRCPAGMDAWLVGRYDDVRDVLANPRLSSRGAAGAHMMDEVPDPVPGWMFQLDGEEHTRLRRLLMREFTVRRTEALRPAVQRIADEHVDAMLTGTSADLVRDFALPVPLRVVCELLGVPYDDHEAFHRHSEALGSYDTDDAGRAAALGGITGSLREVIERRLVEPGDDLLSRLIARGDASGRPPTVEELVNIGVMLLVAGHETTAYTIALSVAALLEKPERYAALRTGPEAIGTAVEELLRYLSVIQFGAARYATEDVTVGGTRVRAGEWLLAAFASGNRDERVFPDAGAVDLGRQGRTHLTFGFGPHQCLGQQLARVELQVTLATLARRLPDLRLTRPLEQADFRRNDLVYGPRSMPVTW